MSRRTLSKSFRVNTEVSASIHENISRGFTQILPDGTRVFVPYQKEEMGEIHSFISPSRSRFKHMKWTKTHEWKDQEKAKKSRWKYTPTFKGLNTISK